MSHGPLPVHSSINILTSSQDLLHQLQQQQQQQSIVSGHVRAYVGYTTWMLLHVPYLADIQLESCD